MTLSNFFKQETVEEAIRRKFFDLTPNAQEQLAKRYRDMVDETNKRNKGANIVTLDKNTVYEAHLENVYKAFTTNMEKGIPINNPTAV